MLNWITNILWKNQNFLGKVQLVVITVLVGVIYYYKAYLGIYKHKYVSGLETDKIELLQEVEDDVVWLQTALKPDHAAVFQL